MLIGQDRLCSSLKKLIDYETLPRFIILVGPRGCGKKTVSNWLATMIGGQTYILPDIKVDTVRGMIDETYKQKTKTVVIIPDADNMSLAAKNSLLKVTEEPPNNTYFIMTLEALHNTLDTIKSRATVYTLDNYSGKELEQFIDTLSGVTEEDKKLLLKVGTVPGQLKQLYEFGVQELFTYVDKVVDNIAVVSGSNCFKIADKVALKNDSEGYDIELFLQMFIVVCFDRYLLDRRQRWLDGCNITETCINNLHRITGVSKQYLFDGWILEVRRAWM